MTYTQKAQAYLRKPAYAPRQGLTLAAALLFMASPLLAANITGVWVNEGGDKVSRDELRATLHTENKTGKVINRAWDGTTVTLAGAHNEVISFNLALEAAQNSATNVSVTFDTLNGPNGATIHSTPATGNGVFSWTNRPIELFYERYLQIRGLSYFGYYKGDERVIPTRFQRPWTGNGVGIGLWSDRPDHDKFYPDILVPLELVPNFTIAAGQNQSVWADIYIPKTAPAGTYTGTVTVSEDGQATRAIPVQLQVYGFALPDVPSAQVMAAFNRSDIMWRYVAGQGNWVNSLEPSGSRMLTITDKYYELFHRHKIALLGDNECVNGDHPCSTSVPRYDGSLFTAANGYDGPGVNTPVGVYAVGLYGDWGWKDSGEAAMWSHADNWISWFDKNAPKNEAFLYLEDEPPSSDMPKIDTWSKWLKEDPGPGNRLLSMSTHHMVLAQTDAPNLGVPVTHAGIGACPAGSYYCDSTNVNQAAADFYSTTPGRRLWIYNDGRPGAGTLDTEDDGVSPRQMPWAQYRKNVSRWFYWDVNLSGTQDLFQNALTWGSYQFFDPSLGEYGWDGTSNGNGILSYPGTDLIHPNESYGVDGPFASLRLKEWRRGLQDIDYVTLASKIDPVGTKAIVDQVLPRALWEYPAPHNDVSYYNGPLGWSVNPDDWETARAKLAQIIQGAQTPTAQLPSDGTQPEAPATTVPPPGL